MHIYGYLTGGEEATVGSCVYISIYKGVHGWHI
jgi:hypothetical protein